MGPQGNVDVDSAEAARGVVMGELILHRDCALEAHPAHHRFVIVPVPCVGEVLERPWILDRDATQGSHAGGYYGGTMHDGSNAPTWINTSILQTLSQRDGRCHRKFLLVALLEVVVVLTYPHAGLEHCAPLRALRHYRLELVTAKRSE